MYRNHSGVFAPEVQERARLAAERARKLKTTQWLPFARAVTRNPKLKMEFTKETPRTDGKTIWLTVPITLGDKTPHELSNCGKRNEYFQQVCSACKIQDEVAITIFHEVAHIAFNSFMPLDEQDKIKALAEAIRVAAKGQPNSTRAKKLEQRYKDRPPYGFMEAANIISPWLGTVLNAAEDGRVNTAMMEARIGTKAGFKGQVYSVFNEGIEQTDGSKIMWRDQSRDLQAVIAVYCKVTGVDYSTYLDPAVVEALDDPTLDELCVKLKTGKTARATFQYSVPVLERLRELDFCKDKNDVEDDEPPKQENKKDESKPKEKNESKTEPPSEEDDESEPGMGDQDDEESSEDSTPEEAGDEGDDETESDDQGDANVKSNDEEGGEGGDQSNADQDGTSADDEAEPANGSGDGSTGTSGDQGDQTGEDETEPADDGTSASDEPTGDDEAEPAEDEPTGDQGEQTGDDGTSAEAGDTGENNPPTFAEAEPVAPLPDRGEPDEVEKGLNAFMGHDEKGEVGTLSSEMEDEAVSIALWQAEHFDAPSMNVQGVVIRKWGDDNRGSSWSQGMYYDNSKIDIPETILAPALGKLRHAFSENKKNHFTRNLKSGRINTRVLGNRVATGDERLFQTKTKPAKRDYYVHLELDVSGSTATPGVLETIKESSYAMAELLARLGVKFSIYAHTGTGSSTPGMSEVELYEVKAADEPWSAETKTRLESLTPSDGNLDGHTLEFCRKMVQKQKATDKIIMYYTDGAMPAMNYGEELEILQREIKHCRANRITLVGVGIRTDSPREHGLDTIQLDSVEDVPLVVTELEKRLNQ